MSKKKAIILLDYVGESLNATPNVRVKTLCDNFDVDIYLRNKVEDLSGLNAKSFNEYNLIKLFQSCIKNKYDIIYTSPIHHYFIAWICSKLSRGKLVLDIFDDITLSKALIKTQKGIQSKIKYFIYSIVFAVGKIVIKYADKVFLTLNKNILTYYPKRSRGYKHLTNGIWSSIVQENIKKQMIKSKIETFQITYVGYVREDRGIFKILEAAERIKEKTKQDFKFNILGPIDKNDELEINSYIKNHGLERNFKFYGFSKYEVVKQALELSDLAIYFFPTGRRELDYIYPIKIFEYLSFGLPIIATNGYGIEDIKEDFPSQIKTCEYNSNQLASLILDTMIENPQKEVSETISKYYWESINKSFLNEIQELF